MSTLVTILFILTAVLLIGVILIQQPKTAGGLFSGTGQSLLGTSGKTFWTKFTTILAAVFMAFCVLLSFFPSNRRGESAVANEIEKQQQAATQKQAAPAQAAPAQPPVAAPKPDMNTAPKVQSAPVPVAPVKK